MVYLGNGPGTEKEGNESMTIGVMMALKDKLQELRRAAGLTQQELATAAGLSVSVVQHIERGAIPDPRVSTLKAVAKALDATIDELIANGGEASSRPARGKRRRKKGDSEKN
jgi:transcriptional regulator with XRE-family HTH domain